MSKGGPSHLVGQSSYPLVVSSHLYFLVTSLLMYFKYSYLFVFWLGLLSLLYALYLWSKDVCLEALSGNHNLVVQSGIKVAFFLFVFSEVMFFASIFWVFFDASLSPSIDVGGVWPPFGITPPDYFGLPLLGTVLLLSSGVTVTWSHSQLLSNVQSSLTLGLTVLLAISFLTAQSIEYYLSSFSIGDGIYGTVFFFATGFHGFHVLLGSLLLLFSLYCLISMHYSSVHHLGLELSIVYWHMVDVVWVLLYVFLYCWGS